MAAKKTRYIRYFVERHGKDDIVVEVPSTWKVTFGYVNPAKSSDAYRGGQGHCLRMYEGEKLRFVMGDVLGFRDLEIPLARKFEKQSGESKWESDSRGNFEESTKKQLESGFEILTAEDPFSEDDDEDEKF